MSWRDLLRAAVAKKGLSPVARELHYSPSTISQVVNEKYGANPLAIKARVLATYGGGIKMTVPEGFLENHKGHLVRESEVSALEKQADGLVRELIAEAERLAQAMAVAKRRWLEAIQAHIQLAADQYKVKVVGANGNVALQRYDGSARVERQHSRRLVVNERVAVAKELVNRYVEARAAELDEENKALVRAALRVDDKGNHSPTALLSLARKIKSTSPEWQAAVAAINDSVTTEYGEAYVRFQVRGADGNYQQIALDLSAVVAGQAGAGQGGEAA